MAGRVGIIKTFQRAFLSKGIPIIYHTTQFYSTRQKRLVTQYHLKKSITDPETGRTSGEEIFNTYYQLYIVFFLRDLWSYVNGKEIDTSNEIWESYKQKHDVRIEGVIDVSSESTGR